MASGRNERHEVVGIALKGADMDVDLSLRLTEAIAEVHARCYGVKNVIFRVPLICGGGQRELDALREFVPSAIKEQPVIIWGDGSTLVLGNTPVSVKELAEKVVERAGRGEVQSVSDKPKLFDQYTRRDKAEPKLGWSPKIGEDEIIERVVKQTMSHS